MMRFPRRIKYSEDIIDQQCLIAAGGRIDTPEDLNKPPMFVFGSEMQRRRYEELRKERREKATAPTVTNSES